MCGRTACTLSPSNIKRACAYRLVFSYIYHIYLFSRGTHRTVEWEDDCYYLKYSRFVGSKEPETQQLCIAHRPIALNKLIICSITTSNSKYTKIG